MPPQALAAFATGPAFTPPKPGRLGKRMMGLAALAMVAMVLIAYPYARHFSLPAQIAAHLLLPVAAGVFKLGYVVHLAAEQAHGNHVTG